MKNIPLSQNLFALVDDEDYEYLKQWNWTAVKHRDTFYVLRKVRIGNKRINIHMHRLITKAPDQSQVDHKNGNGLDNRKSNLRLATPRQNSINRKRLITNTSGYPGIHWQKKNKKWIVRISLAPNQRVHLGLFASLDDAITARQDAENQIYGEFVRNKKEVVLSG